MVAIESGGLLDILAHPNPAKDPKQRVLVVACDNYAYLVPFLEEDDYFFLKTAIPSRKATKEHLNQGEADVKINKYEREVLAAYEKGPLKAVATKAEIAKFKAAAHATAIKDRRVSNNRSSRAGRAAAT